MLTNINIPIKLNKMQKNRREDVFIETKISNYSSIKHYYITNEPVI